MPEPHGTLQEGAIVLLGPSLGSPDVTVSNKRGKAVSHSQSSKLYLLQFATR